MIKMILIILILVILIHGWVKVLMHEWTKFENNLALYAVMILRVSKQEARSLIRGFSYCVYGGLMAGIVWYFSEFPSVRALSAKTVMLSLLGAFAELSTVRLLTIIYALLHPEVNLIDEIQKVRWVSGAFKLSRKFVVIVIVGAAIIEEVFFRGSVMYLLLKIGASQLLALCIVTFLFVYEQILLVETHVQKILIGGASIVISVIGGLLVLTTNTIWPAMFAHASFVIFYVREW